MSGTEPLPSGRFVLSEAVGDHLAREVIAKVARNEGQPVDLLMDAPGNKLRLVRATRAIPLFRTPQKVEAVAWDVGYRSKKDLYTALERWVGATPTELRELSADEGDWLERQLRTRCLQGPTKSSDPAERGPAGMPTLRRRAPPRRPMRRPRM